ncbi:LysR family transcriptional regulator [Nocardia sp. NPDC059240]|uniref:LysR family transcriptional regulator n=1 Tax=Nocardia sp. NPDC059240 TaxID=3346786 RepID=UPI0036A98A6B
MTTLDIAPLRSFTAVVAFSGVRRAAQALHLSQSAVSGHIRKLEKELGCRLVTAQGRGIGLTSDGEELAVRARAILQFHDEAVRALAPPQDNEVVVAATEHAAEFVVPAVISALTTLLPDHRIRLRLTRSARVRDLVHDERADIALMLTSPARGSLQLGTLPVRWFGAENAPRDRLVLFSNPCAVRHQALAVLGRLDHRIVKECSDLTTVLTAARNGIGITPLPVFGSPPDGLKTLVGLPAIPNATLYAAASGRVDSRTKLAVIAAVREQLFSG